jgi:hypothetical protein
MVNVFAMSDVGREIAIAEKQYDIAAKEIAFLEAMSDSKLQINIAKSELKVMMESTEDRMVSDFVYLVKEASNDNKQGDESLIQRIGRTIHELFTKVWNAIQKIFTGKNTEAYNKLKQSKDQIELGFNLQTLEKAINEISEGVKQPASWLAANGTKLIGLVTGTGIVAVAIDVLHKPERAKERITYAKSYVLETFEKIKEKIPFINKKSEEMEKNPPATDENSKEGASIFQKITAPIASVVGSLGNLIDSWVKKLTGKGSDEEGAKPDENQGNGDGNGPTTGNNGQNGNNGNTGNNGQNGNNGNTGNNGQNGQNGQNGKNGNNGNNGKNVQNNGKNGENPGNEKEFAQIRKNGLEPKVFNGITYAVDKTTGKVTFKDKDGQWKDSRPDKTPDPIKGFQKGVMGDVAKQRDAENEAKNAGKPEDTLWTNSKGQSVMYSAKKGKLVVRTKNKKGEVTQQEERPVSEIGSFFKARKDKEKWKQIQDWAKTNNVNLNESVELNEYGYPDANSLASFLESCGIESKVIGNIAFFRESDEFDVMAELQALREAGFDVILV